MTIVKFKQKPFEQNFNNWMDDFFPLNASINRENKQQSTFKQNVPVNITEVENGYRLDLIAPGFEKEAFKIQVDKNLLIVSADVKKESETGEKIVRNEYRYTSFNRSFTIDETIDAENIAASYNNGVLTLNLPKKEVVKPATKNITIQ